MNNVNKVTFVYLGKKLPKYAEASLKLAEHFSGFGIELITNAECQNNENNIVSLDDFYDAALFHKVISERNFPNYFRDGFWIKTLERFFVLEQYMEFANYNSVFHAELDQILFRADLLVENIEKLNNKGIFFPYHRVNEPIASVFYCNNLSAIKSLTKFALESKNYKSDMQLLGEWSGANSKESFILPTLSSELLHEEFQTKIKSKILNRIDIGGIVDGAQLGQWVAGIDPRNVPLSQKPANHFVDSGDPLLLSSSELKKNKFIFDEGPGLLKLINAENKSTIVYNLHLHSKIHKWLLNSNTIEKLLFLSNSPHQLHIRVSRSHQIYFFIINFAALLKQKFFSFIRTFN